MRIKKQKPLGAFDALSISNREPENPFSSLDKKAGIEIMEVISKEANENVDAELIKEANFSQGFQLFGNVKRTIASKLGVSDNIAEELTSKVITKSEQITREFGGVQDEIIQGIIDEMSKQPIGNMNTLNGSFELHPMVNNPGQTEEYIKNRLMREFNMSARDAEMYKNIVYKNAKDLAVTLRPKKREEIAKALIDLVVDTKDQTIIYNIKSSPTLLEALKSFM